MGQRDGSMGKDNVWMEPPVHSSVIWKASFLSLSSNPALSEDIQGRKDAKKPRSTFLATIETPSPVAASSQSPRLSIPAFDYLGTNPVCGRHIITPRRQAI